MSCHVEGREQLNLGIVVGQLRCCRSSSARTAKRRPMGLYLRSDLFIKSCYEEVGLSVTPLNRNRRSSRASICRSNFWRSSLASRS